MSTDLEALARNLAESGRVPWVRGMVEESGAICQRALAGLPLLWCVDDSVVSADGCEPALLDLTDDGNRGHLLARARVLRDEPTLLIVPHVRRADLPSWKVVRWDGASMVNVLRLLFETETEALVQAVLLGQPLLNKKTP